MGKLNKSQILDFPHQILDVTELKYPDHVDVMARQVCLESAKILNAIHNGQLELTPKVIEDLEAYNGYLKQFGYKELSFDFSGEQSD